MGRLYLASRILLPPVSSPCCRFGVRIEDIVAATEDGGRRFNTTSREIQIVE